MKAYAVQGTGRVYSPNRRGMLVGGVALASQFLLGASSDGGGCGSDQTIAEALQVFSLGAAAIASGGVSGLVMMGIEVGYLALRDYTEQQLKQTELPKTVPVRYTAKSTQGTGQVYDFPALPVQGQGQGVTTLSTDGPGYVATTSPVEEPITALQIVDANKNASGVNNTQESYLAGLPQQWLPNSALFLVGLTQKTYTQILATTQSGRKITIDLI